MASNIPLYKIAKELNIETNRIILACKSIGINAKGATKRLNQEELEQLKNYFETGKNVSNEIVEINQNPSPANHKTQKLKRKRKTEYFPNRLIGKS